MYRSSNLMMVSEKSFVHFVFVNMSQCVDSLDPAEASELWVPSQIRTSRCPKLVSVSMNINVKHRLPVIECAYPCIPRKLVCKFTGI